MARPSTVARLGRLIAHTPPRPRTRPRITVTALPPAAPRRAFSPSARRPRGIMPETDRPSKPDVLPLDPGRAVVELSDSAYHDLADLYLERLLSRFEQLQDAREDVDVEYSSGVMTINVADKGTYVVNKQPPNKQIWLSSPISGPKRYDWCVIGDGQAEKEGTGTGTWVYARDGVTLSELILHELAVVVEEEPAGR